MDPRSPQSTPAEPVAASDLKADGEGIRQAARESVSAGVDIRARVNDVTVLALKARKFALPRRGEPHCVNLLPRERIFPIPSSSKRWRR